MTPSGREELSVQMSVDVGEEIVSDTAGMDAGIRLR
jgi:hypothetical protein